MLGKFWEALGDLGPSWAALWAPWAGLDGSWGHLGKVLWTLKGVVEGSWVGPGASWGRLGAVFGGSWGVLAANTRQGRGGREFWGLMGTVLGSIFEGFSVPFRMIFP